jgi:hypothetical protein
MTSTRLRDWLLRGADAIAVVALFASIVLVAQRLSSQATPAPGNNRPLAQAGKPGDRDGDGVPDAIDLEPDVPAPRAAPTASAAPVGGAASSKLPPADDCRRKGITRRVGKEGVCYEPSGRRVRVVNRDSPLVLAEISARLLRLQVRRDPAQRTAEVLADLRVESRLSGIVDLQASHFGLLLGHGFYGPDVRLGAEHGGSLLRTGFALRKGRVATGRLEFRVPLRAPRHLGRDGNLQILQFSDASFQSASTVGVIRTYR